MEQQIQPKRAGRSARAWAITALVAIAALAASAPALAGDWSFRLQGIAMDAYGHDQHVLTVNESDAQATPALASSTAVKLDTNSGLAWRGAARYRDGLWGYGLDFFWFSTSQDLPDLTAAGSAAGGALSFEIADRLFTAGPGETLFYRVLEDTDVAVWAVDLYVHRTLAETATSGVRLQLGLRVGDFDNDYRAVVGVEGAGGARLDASSNYGQLIGPIVGLAGEVRLGKSTLEAALAQALVLGSVELSGRSRRFSGAFSESETQAFFDDEAFRADEDVAIPISELRLEWRYQANRWLSLGAGAHASVWWELPVPPGVIPGPGGDRVLHENTIVFYGLLASVGVTF